MVATLAVTVGALTVAPAWARTFTAPMLRAPARAIRSILFIVLFLKWLIIDESNYIPTSKGEAKRIEVFQ